MPHRASNLSASVMDHSKLPPSTQESLIRHLHFALDALERGDESAWQHALEQFSQWHTQPLLKGLSRLARELGQTLGQIPDVSPELHLQHSHAEAAQGTVTNGVSVGELGDVCGRLNHVVDMTSEATHRTLDLTDQCREWTLQMEKTNVTPEQLYAIKQIRGLLSDISIAQSYQDISGQIIRRVMDIVAKLHLALTELGLNQNSVVDAPDLAGPVVAGVDKHGVSQNDADDLLSNLGL